MPTAFRRTSSDLAADPISLTLVHVSAVPKRNNEQYIAVYLRSQSALLKQWALDGAKESAFWDAPTAGTENNPAFEAIEEGFGSPILKARVPEKNYRPIEGPTASQRRKSRDALVDTTKNNQPATHATQGQEQDKYHHKDVPDTDRKPRTHPKKRVVTAGSDVEGDIEVEMRLSERRERKKLKRTIMSPEVSDKESQPEAKKGKKARKATAKTPTGFALMHGFSATNVGKNRLTLDRILQTAGVFGKGKASSTAKVVKNGKPSVFSESDFLKKGSRATMKPTGRKRSPPPSLVNFSSSSSSSSSSSIRHKRQAAKRQKKRRRPRSPTVSLGAPEGSRVSSLSTTIPVRTRPAYDPANSIMWDIEKDSHVSASVSKTGTVLVKVPHTLGRETVNRPGPMKDHPIHAEGAKNFSNDPTDHTNNLDTHVFLDRSSMLSLGPSESASQAGKASARQPQPVITSTSKYFRPADTAMEPRPVEDLPSQPMSIYAPKKGCLSASTQTVATLNVPDAFRSALEPTGGDSILDWEVPDCGAQDLDPLRHRPDELCFWSQVGYDLNPQDEYPVVDNVNVCLSDDYAVSSDLFHCQESNHCRPHYDIGPTSVVDEELSFGDYNCRSASPVGRLHALDIDLACEEDHTICHDQDMEYIPSTQTSGWTESSTLPTLEEHSRFDIASGRDFSEGDMVEEIIATASSDLSTTCGALITFQQGRGLLRGLGIHSGDNRFHSLSKTEAEVADNLRRNHWLPQRF